MYRFDDPELQQFAINTRHRRVGERRKYWKKGDTTAAKSVKTAPIPIPKVNGRPPNNGESTWEFIARIAEAMGGFAALAERLGCRPKTLYRYRRTRKPPARLDPVLRAIAEELGVTFGYRDTEEVML